MSLTLKDRITKTTVAKPSTSSTAELIARDNQLASSSESLGQFKAYANDLPIAEITGTRIVKCLYQVNKQTGKKAGENSYVRIPTKHISASAVESKLTTLMPHIIAFLQAEEDKSIKAQHKSGSTQIFTDYLSLDKIIESLESTNSASSRLTKDSIISWFDESMQEPMLLLICDKLDITDDISEAQERKIETMLNAYKAKLASLASPKTYMLNADKGALINVINKCELADDELGARLIAKLGAMTKKEEESLLEL